MQQNPASPDPKGQGQALSHRVGRKWEAWKSSQISARERGPGKHSVVVRKWLGWEHGLRSLALPRVTSYNLG